MTPYRDELPEVLKSLMDFLLAAVWGLGILSFVYVVTVIVFALEKV